MAAVATGAGHLSCHAVNAFPKFFSGNNRTQRVLLDKDRIGMASVACPIGVRNMRHGFAIFARKDIVLSVTIIASGRPFGALHDHFGMEALQILLLHLLMARSTVYPFVRRLLPAFGVSIILNPSVAI